MFAKLKKKVLEEGEAGGPERLGFSPRKLPGGAVAVRSPPEVVAAASVGGDDEVDGVKGEGEGGEGEKEVETKTEEAKPLLLQSIDLHPTALPSHLQSSLTQETVHQELLKRISQQQEELVSLSQKLQDSTKAHEEERGKWKAETATKIAEKDTELQVLQNRFDKVDGEATELKLQVVELQLEKADCEQRLEGETSHLQERLVEVEREKEEGERVWGERKEELQNRVTELEELLAEKEVDIENLKDQVKSLETKKMESLSNLVEVSQDEVVHKLQNEIIDLEKRLRSKTMEIDIARVDTDTQLRWKEEQLEEGVTRQLNLMAAEKELKEKVVEKNEELQELRRELERERIDGGKKEKEIAQLTGELEEATKTVQQLQQQVEETEVSHAKHLQEMATQRDTRVAELSKALEELRGDILGSETVVSPERNPLDFATVATQTDIPVLEREASVPAVLHVNSFPDTSINGKGGSDGEEEEEDKGTANMQSHGLIEELQSLRQEQLRLQEEVSEKNKLIRFQQLKIVDMRKALNKELRSQTSQDMTSQSPLTSVPHSMSSPLTPPWQRGNVNSPGGRITSYEDVNIQYLKHVIIKFLCSREDEATQLIRAVSTLLDFTTQEEQFVRDYFDYKMSWFGSMPPPIYHPVRKTNPVQQS